jgi:predicted transposase YbfD/YdcC
LWLNLDDAEYIRERLGFPGCQIALRVDREARSPSGKILLSDSRYFVASIDPASVTSSGLQSYVREHWQVENCLHFVKDRWWDEDRHYTKRPGLAEAFAALTNAALSILRFLREAAQSLRATAEAVHSNPLTALHRLGFIRLVRRG